MALKLSLFERRLRLTTGLILTVYIVIHLVNHALGLVSLEAMEAMRQLVTPFWRSWFGGLLIYGSLLAHLGLALVSLYRRTTLRMPTWELAQLVLGLSVVPLLAGHIADTWGARVLMGFNPNYQYALTNLLSDRWELARQGLLMLIVWGHAVLGLHFFLRLFRSYRHWRAHLYPLVLLLPLLVVLSMIRIGNDLQVWPQLSAPADNRAALLTLTDNPPNDLLRSAILLVYFTLLGLTLLARSIRDKAHKSTGITISHINGQTLKGRPGQTLLEIIRSHSIPHASLCGGRGRCTTCRVRIDEGGSTLEKPSPLEQSALDRIGAAPNVRLACQTRPRLPLKITPLMPPDLNVNSEWREGGVSGEERDVVALFVDLRGSSRISEKHMPYDVLFILNRFFLEMSDALTASHGHYAQFEGDGLLALYGLRRGLAQGCDDALRGAIDMQARIDRLNRQRLNQREDPFRIGIGIHCGQAIVGTMGPPTSPNYSAIGDCVNAAARLEASARDLGCVLVVSGDVVQNAGADLARFASREISLRGKQQSVLVYLVEDPLQIEMPPGNARE
ncbi:MAG: adenylate/guanylate cyclase domain-containing protein [Gammaproteobacteria bacterium]|nr:adenylate/guanylate cyclase domain-containing protein [Gammaproteobacteria bacterium]